jgi:hypothetical protein
MSRHFRFHCDYTVGTAMELWALWVGLFLVLWACSSAAVSGNSVNPSGGDADNDDYPAGNYVGGIAGVSVGVIDEYHSTIDACRVTGNVTIGADADNPSGTLKSANAPFAAKVEVSNPGEPNYSLTEYPTLAAAIKAAPTGISFTIKVGSKANLADIATTVTKNGGHGGMDYHYYLEGDIHTPVTTPIGSYAEPFTGLLVSDTGDNGAVYAVTVNITKPAMDGTTAYAGLFAYIGAPRYATHHGVYDVRITGSVNLAGAKVSKLYAGALAGALSGTANNKYAGVVGRVKSVVSINTASLSADTAYTGGIIGYTEEGSAVASCSVSGDITTGDVNAHNYAGGIVGYNYKAWLSDCAFSGNIKTGAPINSGVHVTNCAGGVVGYNLGSTVAHCYTTGAVSASASDNANYAGGIVGYNRTATPACKVTFCYATGTVFTGGSCADNAGGIVGRNDTNSEVNHCVALNANITINTTSKTSEYAGRIAGVNSGNITNCYASATLAPAVIGGNNAADTSTAPTTAWGADFTTWNNADWTFTATKGQAPFAPTGNPWVAGNYTDTNTPRLWYE